jgi:thiol-disulfide isomerase/thioredoxin
MGKTTALKGFLAGCLLLVTGVGSARAATVADMLKIKPDFPDIQITTPSPQEYASCELKWVKGNNDSSGTYLLLDGRKQLLRRYVLVGGKIQTFSYYKDGVEVYREIANTTSGKKHEYRWLNSGGMKWGIASREDGKIDQWKMISAEEASQEVFAALAAGDFTRLQALFVTDVELRTLPAAEGQRIAGLIKNASYKFQATRSKTPGLDAKAHFVRVESAVPQCIPADANGSEQEQIRFPYRTILFESSEKDKEGKAKHDFVQTGELIKIGLAWRLIEGPGIGDGGETTDSSNPALAKLYDDLAVLDKTPPPPLPVPGIDKSTQDYNLKRVAIINKILTYVQGTDKENWIKQKLDNLSSAYQAGEQASLVILADQRDHFVKSAPGSEMAAFATYRHLWALYAEKLAKSPTAPIQNKWLDELAKFAQTYPNAEDTPEALRLLATGCEYAGKDEEAKRWYQLIAKNFPNLPMAQSAAGAVRRLDLIGRNMTLAGPQLGTNAPFNVNNMTGKLVVVYYWSSTVSVCATEFTTLKRLQAAHGKDVEFVTISLDANPQAATQFLQKAQLPAINLYTPGEFSSPLATYYGINTLPTMFLIGKDGRVIDRNLQANDLEIALRKAL